LEKLKILRLKAPIWGFGGRQYDNEEILNDIESVLIKIKEVIQQKFQI
jgi:hypothetical protein